MAVSTDSAPARLAGGLFGYALVDAAVSFDVHS